MAELIDLSSLDVALPECDLELPSGVDSTKFQTFTGGGDSSFGVTEVQAPQSDESAVSTTFVIVTNSKERNRVGNVIQLAKSKYGDGLKLDQWKRNPTVLFGHGYDASRGYLPIGSGRKTPTSKAEIKGNASQLLSAVYWDQGDPFSMNVFRLCKAGMMNAASIGYGPEKAIRIQSDDGRVPNRPVRPEDPEIYTFDYGGWLVVQGELREWSVCAIGADKDALRQAAFGSRMHNGDALEGAEIRRTLAQMLEKIDRLTGAPPPATVQGWTPEFAARFAPLQDLTDDEISFARQSVLFRREMPRILEAVPAAVPVPAAPSPVQGIDLYTAAALEAVVVDGISRLRQDVQGVGAAVNYAAGKPA